MEANKKISLSALTLSGLIVLSMVVPGFFDTPKYFCESRPEQGFFECDGFGKYVDLNGRCINATQNDITYSSKICRDGWKIVIDDYVFPDEKGSEIFVPKQNIQPSRIETFTNGTIIHHD